MSDNPNKKTSIKQPPKQKEPRTKVNPTIRERLGNSARDLGTSLLKKAFPTLTAIRAGMKEARRERELEKSMAAIDQKRIAERVEGFSTNFSLLIESQRQSVGLLRELLDAVKNVKEQGSRIRGLFGNLAGLLGGSRAKQLGIAAGMVGIGSALAINQANAEEPSDDLYKLSQEQEIEDNIVYTPDNKEISRVSEQNNSPLYTDNTAKDPVANDVTPIISNQTPSSQEQAPATLIQREPITLTGKDFDLKKRIAREQGESSRPVIPATVLTEQENTELVQRSQEQARQIEQQEVRNNRDQTLGNLFAMDLLLKAKSITFKGDEIEFVSPTQTQSAVSGSSNIAAGVSSSPVQQIPPAPIAPSTGMGSAPSSPTIGGTATPTVPSENTELNFAPGVDKRINSDIAQKVKQIETAFGKRLTVTSGYRDPQRNAAVGGARNSAHTRANAVDIQFQGNEQDTVRLIEAASAAGIGGIGVYRPGWLHLDTESKRVWGPDFSASSIPQWAAPAMQAHMSGRTQQAQRTEAPSSVASITPQPQQNSPTGGGGSVASPNPATPTSGRQLLSASQDNSIASRIPSAPPAITPESTPNGQDPGSTGVGGSMTSGDPGNVEPDDAAERYRRLFNMAA
jgi:hypothetical protein